MRVTCYRVEGFRGDGDGVGALEVWKLLPFRGENPAPVLGFGFEGFPDFPSFDVLDGFPLSGEFAPFRGENPAFEGLDLRFLRYSELLYF